MALAAPSSSLPTRPRRSTSAVSYSDAEAKEVGDLLERLGRFGAGGAGSAATDGVGKGSADGQATVGVEAALNTLHTLRQLIVDHAAPNRLRDAFRNWRGFVTLLEMPRRTVARLLADSEDKDRSLLLSLLHAAFNLLSTALREHWGNQRFFRDRVQGGGWLALQEVLEQLLDGERNASTNGKPTAADTRERVSGFLLACALDDDSLSELFLRLGRASRAEKLSGDLVRTCESSLTASLGKVTVLAHPDALAVLFELWLRGRQQDKDKAPSSDATALFVPTVVRVVADTSAHALAALHRTRMLSRVLHALELELDAVALAEIKLLATVLLSIGLSDVRDAKYLFREAMRSKAAAETLQQALRAGPSPQSIHFDLSLHGYSSIELPDLGRTFPPVSNSAGYTLSLWFQVLHFDSELHTTIFGAFDPSQTCFVLVYLEKDTRNLILQTSVTSTRPSVRFKGYTFKPQRWYHLCIVHKRPKAAAAARASLFVDGEFVEQAKAQYPASPPAPAEGDSRRHNAVQTFLGTPQDLATKLGSGASSLKWKLASAHLFNEALGDDLIAVYKELGPRYTGNYQDCLGSFQTYEASAALNLRNETLHPGREEKSDIVAAIRARASSLLPEHRVLLNFSPAMALGDGFRVGTESAQLVKNFGRRSVHNLQDSTRGGRNAIVTNGSIPCINEALLHHSGIATLTGQPAVVGLHWLDDACWTIGGCCSVSLAMLDAAESKESVIRALEIIFGTVKHSWRNSEAMERENGFGVLSSLLTTKLQQMAPSGRPHRPFAASSDPSNEDFLSEVLTMILEFVGYDPITPENSVINNPLAYRILLVDLDIWRSTAPKVQRLYYEQFTTFGVGSKHHVFNAKRLARMRIVKRWLEALKSDSFYPDTIDNFLSALRALLDVSCSAETLRAIALYITYALQKAKDTSSLKSKKSLRSFNLDSIIRRSTTPSPTPGASFGDRGSEKPLSRPEVGTKVLALYADMLCAHGEGLAKKFAKTVTNRWLLFMLSDTDPRVVVLAMRILARVLVVNGPGYVDKFADKTGGFIVMRSRLRKFWSHRELWVLCFAVLFGRDVAGIDLNRPFDLFGLIETFQPAEIKIVYPAITPVIVSMLQTGLKFIIQGQRDPASPAKDNHDSASHRKIGGLLAGRARSSSVIDPEGGEPSHQDKLELAVKTTQTITRFLSDLHAHSSRFKDFAAGATYVQELLFLLFPVLVSADIVSTEMEIHARESMTFQGNDVVIKPLSQSSAKTAPIVRTATVDLSSPNSSRIQPLKRGSSFVLVTSEESQYQPSSARLETIASPKHTNHVPIPDSHALVQDVLEIVVAVFSEQILYRKDFQGIGLFMKVPPGFQEHQAYFETFILRNLVSSLSNTLKLDPKLLVETRVITNLSRFCHHLDESVYEGWFIDGADAVLDFIGTQLEYFQQPDVQNMKSVRLCSENIAQMRAVVCRIALLRLSDRDESKGHTQTMSFLNKLTYWQTVLFSEHGLSDETLRLFCYLMYTNLISIHEPVRELAANLWRLLLVQKSDQTVSVLHRLVDSANESLSRGLQKILELDNQTFLSWVDDHRKELDALFFGKLSMAWESFVSCENKHTQDNFKSRVIKRREKLKVWANEEAVRDEVLRKHDLNSEHWRANIYASEHLKRQRNMQDQQDNLAFNMSSWMRMQQQLRRPFGLLEDKDQHRWQLDPTEGRNRMRMRMIPDREGNVSKYLNKNAVSKLGRANTLAIDTRTKSALPGHSPMPSPLAVGFTDKGKQTQANGGANGEDRDEDEDDGDDDFEMVDEPDTEAFEDKNRKVMRSLQRGDQVEHVHNISRIVGLEACEGLLIIGRMALYLIDHFFQRSDGEIIDAAQAPRDERDSYLQLISGRASGDSAPKPSEASHETRSWRWEDILSISKRRFLFRDVAIEVFFVDGRSYLLTIHTPQLRDALYGRLMARAQSVSSGGLNSPHAEDQWRIEALRTPEDNPQTLGSRFTNVFAQGASNPATRKWIKGEISNFHYLMLVNTMAGRTFNDLTQYPVFPWVLADYSSEELDLSDPLSFRDLSKPMGCQTAERQAEFRERYQSFAEMGDQPPFHYGTHYSSAMIVASYMIRLQPFVQSYLLLQGGVFDHADRLFYSIKRAWNSASRDNMTDVRELIPEFFYLPEMFNNVNEFDFGERQNAGGRIDNVELPPWAKGDPKIFVAKHREALESPYVSAQLHKWIDLVFGHKQRGEAALEATNVFHHLSYRGAKNLDEIDDPVERVATIGIIHNFGQTPHQVFQRAHPGREEASSVGQKLDTLADTLTRVPFPLIETPERVSSLLYSARNERLLCSGPFRLHLPPAFDKYLEWGYADGGVRFFASSAAEGGAAGKPPLARFEHVDQGQLTAARFIV